MKRKFVTILALTLGMTALVGCGGAGEEETKELNVQFVPTNNDGSMEAKAKPFEEYLSEKLGHDVNVTLATDYSTIVEAMASRPGGPGYYASCCLCTGEKSRRGRSNSDF